jgi:copper(I)-binding protein
MKGNPMRTFTRSAAVGLFASALILSGCGSDDESTDAADTTEAAETTEAAAAEGFEITDVWARQSPMGTTAGAVYLNITSAEGDALVGASVPEDIAGTVEVHETVMAEDMDDDTSGDDMSGEEMSEEGMDESTETTMAEDMDDDTSGDDMSGEGEMDMGDEGDMDMGSMTMQEVESIDLPAGETVALEPGGFHIMLLDLVEPLEVGDTFEVTLTFASGATQVVTAEVREG